MGHQIALLTTLAIEGLGMAVIARLLPGWRSHWRRAVVLALALGLRRKRARSSAARSYADGP